MSAAGIPILTWHAMNIAGACYPDNDLVAAARDLETLQALGLRIVPVREIAGALVAGELDRLEGCVGLTLDDGSDFDARDLPHPAHGPQRGFLNVLADFRARHGAEAQPELHATSFVIVSPEARAELDRMCMISCRWWNDDWWGPAEATGLMSIESHGWDHNHELLVATLSTAPRGTFQLGDAEEAEAEIGKANAWLRERRGRDGDVLFAYPYGDVSDFVANEWLPKNGPRHGIAAAIGSDPLPVTPAADRWNIPRFVFRRDWKTEGDLEALLRKLGVRAPRDLPAAGALPPPRAITWRDCLRTWEVNDPRVVAGELFRRHFGHEIPHHPRHFVLVYSPPPGFGDMQPRVVAYEHQTPHEGVYLGGGMVADASAYRRMPKEIFKQVRDEGGLATIITRDCIAMLGDSAASFGYVGEPRARAADLRSGYVDTGVEHLMVHWRKQLPEEEKRRLIALAASVGSF